MKHFLKRIFEGLQYAQCNLDGKLDYVVIKGLTLLFFILFFIINHSIYE